MKVHFHLYIILKLIIGHKFELWIERLSFMSAVIWNDENLSSFSEQLFLFYTDLAE